ncbi:MAG: hypothetical protein NVSMB32_01950 [Actinomycetota bacterium]
MIETIGGQDGRAALATIVLPDGEGLAPGVPVKCGRYLLSRFAYLHRVEDDWVLECAQSPARLIIHDARVLLLVDAFRTPCSPDGAASHSELPPKEHERLVGAMVNGAMLVEAVEGPNAPVGQLGSALESWEFHDLLFHSRTRGGRHLYRVGGTYRFLGYRAPPPAVVEPREGAQVISLVRPELARLEREDPPLAAVQEARRSVRQYDEVPISAEELGEFLFRVGRVADYWSFPLPVAGVPLVMQMVARPYPSAGSLYELELYVAVARCQGVDRALYHYDPQRHQLEHRCGPGSALGQLLGDAAASAGMPAEHLQVLFVVAGRFPRISWKYESIAYSLMLKDVGVLFQTMYLSATAMGLGPCALGYGDAEVLSQATGVDGYSEASVGEFLLGSVARSDRGL